MNHPSPDELLLFASGELAELRTAELASHVANCAPCRDALAQLDETLLALDAVWPRRSRLLGQPALWGVALAAAATLALVLIRQPDAPQRPGTVWSPTTTWSATAGYMAGGTALLDIDARLTRLEQETHYARP